MMSSGVMAALQILVLPVKVRILARQHKERVEGLLRNVTGFFIVRKMITKEQIISLAEEAMQGTDRYIVNVLIHNDNVIELYLDADSSVTIDDCVAVSNFINEKLDRDVEDYELSVSSAGIDEPLLKMRQYKKYIGKDLIITDNEGVKKMYKLLSFNEMQLEVEEAEAKKYGKLTKIIYHDATTLEINKLKEVRPYIKF